MAEIERKWWAIFWPRPTWWIEVDGKQESTPSKCVHKRINMRANTGQHKITVVVGSPWLAKGWKLKKITTWAAPAGPVGFEC